MRLHARMDPVAQPRCEGRVAVERAKVEADRRVEERPGFRAFDPAAHLVHPLLERETQPRVGSHDLPLAQREAARVERLVHAAGEGEEARADRLGGRAVVALEEQTVVLVGAEGLLEAPLAAEGEPAPTEVFEAMILALDLEDALAEAIVQ